MAQIERWRQAYPNMQVERMKGVCSWFGRGGRVSNSLGICLVVGITSGNGRNTAFPSLRGKWGSSAFTLSDEPRSD